MERAKLQLFSTLQPMTEALRNQLGQQITDRDTAAKTQYKECPEIEEDRRKYFFRTRNVRSGGRRKLEEEGKLRKCVRKATKRLNKCWRKKRKYLRNVGKKVEIRKSCRRNTRKNK